MIKEPTGDEALQTYLSRSDVQAALHAHAPVARSGEWQECDILVYIPDAGSMIPYYQTLISQRPDVHIFVYSGDVDVATVPGQFTTTCLQELDGTPISGREWGPWFVNGATVGYVEQFEQYTYATVKGAGHTVPGYMPLASFNMAQRFLQKQNLDGGEVYFSDSTQQKTRILRQSDMLRLYGIGPFP